VRQDPPTAPPIAATPEELDQLRRALLAVED
jgi:hypothetical protein